MGPDFADIDNLIALADSHARDNQLLCNDVCRIILPEAARLPSESLLSGVTLKLYQIVAETESRLTGTKVENPASWSWLTQSGLLRQPSLIHFLMACEAEEMIEERISRGSDTPLGGQIPAAMLNEAHAEIAEAAQLVLAHASLRRRRASLSIQNLPPEILHQLCWQIVAALQMERGEADDAVRGRARQMLLEFDESHSARGAARKLLHFVRARGEMRLSDISHAGCALFVAHLAQESGIPEDFIFNLVHGGSASVLAVIQKSLDIDADQAMRNLAIFAGFELTPRDIMLIDSDYERLDQAAVSAKLVEWKSRHQAFLSAIGQEAAN